MDRFTQRIFPASLYPCKTVAKFAGGGIKALLLSHCHSPFLFRSCSLLSHMHLWYLSSLLQNLSEVSPRRCEHSQPNASTAIPRAPWFGGWMGGGVLFWKRKPHFPKFLHTAKICPCGPEITFSCILLKTLKPKCSWLPKAGACQLSWESWASWAPCSVGSRQCCW